MVARFGHGSFAREDEVRQASFFTRTLTRPKRIGFSKRATLLVKNFGEFMEADGFDHINEVVWPVLLLSLIHI